MSDKKKEKTHNTSHKKVLTKKEIANLRYDNQVFLMIRDAKFLGQVRPDLTVSISRAHEYNKRRDGEVRV
jgi:hypothetical protein